LEKPAPRVVIEEEDPADSLEDSPLRETVIPPAQPSSSEPKSQIQIFHKPPFPERLTIEKPVVQPEFDILNELRNVCVKIPLLQAIKDVPIYTKAVRDLCIKKPGRKRKEPSTVHLVGQISDCLSENPPVPKYANPGNPVVTIGIHNTLIGNTLIDLGAAINIMTWHTMETLQLGPLLRPTPTVLELADRTPIKPIGAIDDLIVTVASWEYPVDFLIISSRDPTKGHPVILGRPWLATANAFIGCRAGEMCISNGTSTKTLIHYPLAQPVEETLWWIEDPYGDENLEEPLLSLDQAKALHE